MNSRTQGSGTAAARQSGPVVVCVSTSVWELNCLVRPEGKRLNSQFNSLGDEELNALFDSLEEWERQLAQLDSKSLRCDDEHFTP